MEPTICCVCHEPVDQGAPRVGGRSYCRVHYAKLSLNRRSVWRSGALNIGALVAFALLVALLAGLTKPRLEGAGLALASLVLAVVPACLWLVFFYAQDRLEAEPKSYVAGVFVLGALLAAAVGIPVVRDLFQVQTWLDHSLVVNLLGSILVVGFVQEFLKYAAVRYSVYLSAEFDERMDGVLYGTAAGLGYATMLNIHYVMESGGVDLGMGVVRIVIVALAQASFGGITGYFLSRSKFEEEPVWWLPAGLTLAAILNGVFGVVRGGVTRVGSALAGSTMNPWYGLLLATLVAALTLGVLFYLIHRANAVTLNAGQSGLAEGGDTHEPAIASS